MGFRYAAAFTVDVSQGVVPVRRAHEDEDTFRPLDDRTVLARREHYVRQVGDGFLQSRVRADGVLPYLVGMGRQVHLAVGFAVEDA